MKELKPHLDDTPRSVSAPLAGEPARNYWLQMDGATYRGMIRDREASGNHAYQQQVKVLTKTVCDMQQAKGATLDVLEFGCGFGRHANYLSPLPGVRYHGYDFSEPMVAPLRAHPPASLSPLSERIFVGPDVVDSVGERRFDLIFTVSVLIHNPANRVRELIQRLASLLTADGRLLLVENRLVPFDVWENSWHDGCWLHCYPELVDSGWDIDVSQGFVPTHDVYSLRRNQLGARRLFLHPALDDETSRVEVDFDQIRLKGLAKLEEWARGVQPGLQGTASSGRISELEERLRVQQALSTRRQRLNTLGDFIAELRARGEQSAPVAEEPVPPQGEREEVVLDHPFDTRWAQVEPRFGRVLHVFHHPWHGIRAASGYLPGHKLVIPANRKITSSELRRAAEIATEGAYSVVAFQGYSSNAEELARILRRIAGRSLRLCVVWHGSTAQFHIDFERQYFGRLLARSGEGLFDAIGGVKPDLCLLSDRIFPETLLNVPPRWDDAPAKPTAPARIAFVPARGNFWKNVSTNVYAAATHPELRTVWAAAALEPVSGLTPCANVVPVGEGTREQVLGLMARADVALNVSLTDCQPMTAVEALAAGTPCLTGRLSLGALDRHPYQQLVQVDGADALGTIRAALDRVLELRRTSPVQLTTMIQDYSRVLREEAYRRLGEFLQV